jgi:TctA family transporter
MVAVLSGRRPVRGLIVAFLGLLIGTVGADPQTGTYRYAFGQPYLFDGLPLIPLALGLFALPEMVDLLIKGTTIASIPKGAALAGALTGVKDAFRHWFLVIRSGIIGALVGVVPGLGGSVVSWFAYGHALQTEKGAHETFGKGDVRGVIAPESANNSQEGGNLIPTLAFGIPASASMALLLSIILVHGIVPGPPMLTTQLSMTYTMIWALAIGNVFGTIICLMLGKQIAKLTTIPIRPLAGLVIALVFLSAMVGGTRQFGDLAILVGMGLVGWTMKRLGWPRPPLLLGFIVSPLIDRYFFISVERYGFEWLTHPLVLVIFALIAVTIGLGIRSNRRPVRPVVPQEIVERSADA